MNHLSLHLPNLPPNTISQYNYTNVILTPTSVILTPSNVIPTPTFVILTPSNVILTATSVILTHTSVILTPNNVYEVVYKASSTQLLLMFKALFSIILLFSILSCCTV